MSKSEISFDLRKNEAPKSFSNHPHINSSTHPATSPQAHTFARDWHIKILNFSKFFKLYDVNDNICGFSQSCLQTE